MTSANNNKFDGLMFLIWNPENLYPDVILSLSNDDEILSLELGLDVILSLSKDDEGEQ